jgi:glycine/D-amino acid oxidase-like deaminating enzyme
MMALHSPKSGVNSLWAATADPAPNLPALDGDAAADVVVIGAGYTGLSAARHIAAAGLDPLVLDANAVGWGASGRNGGFVTPKFRLSLPAIAAAHGRDMARRMYELGHEAVDAVEALVEEFGIDSAGFARVGLVKAAHTERALAAVAAEADWMKAEMGDGHISLLSRDEVRAELGSDGFVGGALTRGPGCIHPLNYVRGLAAGLSARGIRIHEDSPALAIRREPGAVVVETPRGRVRAVQAIIATNAYSDLTGATRAMQRTLVPFRSAILATAPLPPDLAASLLPTRRICSETRRMMRWFRIVDGRFVFGGRGAFGKADSPAAFAALRRAMVALFPMLADIPVEYSWSGLVAMTLDSVPHVGRRDDGLLFALGYNGAGVAMASLMGRYLAAFVRGEAPDVGLLDARRLAPVPFYPLREPAVRAVAGWYQMLDAVGL